MSEQPRKRLSGPPRERILQRTDRSGECWLWTGQLDQAGYAKVKIDGRMQKGHRVAYQAWVGPIPEGLQLDHLCRVRRCVNPAHLEPVTNRENTLRGENIVGINAAKTHCKRGHPFDEANTRVWRNSRICKQCRRNYDREFKQRKRDAALKGGAR